MSNQELSVAEEILEQEEIAAASSSETVTPAATGVEDEAPENIEESSSDPAEEAPAEPAESPPPPETGEISSIYDLKVGQRLTGKVKNIAEFGAFVDVGIPQDGLVHISKLARHKVDKVEDVVSQGQEIEVWVKKVDTKRGRLSLTMIKPVMRKIKDVEEGAELEGIVTRLESYGAFVDINSERDGLVHISQITHEYIKHPEEALKVGDTVRVKVLSVNRKKRQIDLSIKALLPSPVKEEVVVEEKSRPSEKPSSPRHESERARKPTLAESEFAVSEEDEPRLTAMAVAYAAAMQDKDDEAGKEESSSKDKRRKNEALDEIISRTLATRESK